MKVLRLVPRTRLVRLVGLLGLAALVGLAGLGLLGRPMPASAAALPSPSGWPLTGAVSVLRGFDPPSSPWGAGHRGVDLAARAGEPVLAAAAGTVTVAGPVAGRGVVVVSHGAVRTTYEPVTAAVAVGQRVALGAALGTVAVGSHCGTRRCLHWGLREGDRYLDPMALGMTVTHVRLLPASSRAVAQRRAAERAAAATRRLRQARARLAALGPAGTDSGPAGAHHFLRPVPGAVTSGFGLRFHPVLHVRKLHDGTDFAAPCGSPIRAPYPGRVAAVYGSRGYGNRLMLDHGAVDGRRVRTGFNHATRYVVHPGARVDRGEVIGYVGATGYATGCHLHLMVWLNGRLTNPMAWF